MMGEHDSGSKGGGAKKSGGSAVWDSLRSVGQGVLDGFLGGARPTTGVSRKSSGQTERRVAAAQVQRSLKAWRSRAEEERADQSKDGAEAEEVESAENAGSDDGGVEQAEDKPVQRKITASRSTIARKPVASISATPAAAISLAEKRTEKFDPGPLKAKLAGIGGVDAQKVATTVSRADGGAAVAAYLMSGSFDKCKNYSKLVSKLGVYEEVPRALPVFKEAEKLLATKLEVVFEQGSDKPPTWDVDVATLDAAGKIQTALAVKRPNKIEGVGSNLTGAGSQLVNCEAKEKWAVIYPGTGTEAELRGKYWGGVTQFKATYSTTKFRIVLPDGKVVEG